MAAEVPIDMTDIIVQSDTGCSGVCVSEELVVTAKHCGHVKSFTRRKESSIAALVWMSPKPDGVAIYRVSRSFVRRWVQISEGPPKPKSEVSLYWKNQYLGVSGYVEGLETVSFHDPLTRTVQVIEDNAVKVNSVPGSSGGAALQNKRLCGIILNGNTSVRSCGIAVHEELAAGMKTAVALMQTKRVCKVFTAQRCAACIHWKQDFARGKFVELPFDFEEVDLSLNPVPGLSAPSFEIDGERYSPEIYSAARLEEWMRSVMRDQRLEPVPEPPDSPVNVPRARIQQELPDPSQPAMLVEEVDWKGVRIIGVVKKNYSAIQSLMAGPISRMVDNMSNDKVHFETVFEASEPLKYRSVCAATDLTHSDIPVYVFVMVDTIAEVGFVKGQVLAQIERHIDKALTDKMREIPIEVITKRINTDTYNALAKALGTSEVKDRGDEEFAVVDSDKSDDEETTTASHAVATGFSFLSISTLFRVWRFWSSWHHSSTVEQTLALSATVAPATVAPASAPAVSPVAAAKPAASPSVTAPPA